jgi:hypothetical protein
MEQFVRDHQLKGIADFQNNFSLIKHLVKLRSDSDEIILRIRKIGGKIRKSK